MRDTKKALAEGQSPHDGQEGGDLRGRLCKLRVEGGGLVGAPVCVRAKETLEKAKDCISKELVWKVNKYAQQQEYSRYRRYIPCSRFDRVSSGGVERWHACGN